MPTVNVTEADLVHRIAEIRQLLRPLVNSSGGPACRRIPFGGASVIFGAHDGGSAGSDYRDWRFRTKYRSIWANYFEIWNQVQDDQDRWFVTQAYLHLYRRTGRTDETEYFALHCDPEEGVAISSPDARFKRGPHVHVSTAVDPVPKAHLALADGYLDDVFRDLSSLTSALLRGVELLTLEVCDRLR